jgi:hypothetical protein
VRAASRGWLAFVLMGAGLGCVPSMAGWDVARFEVEHPELADWRGHRLGDATPYFAPQRAGIVLFVCRWQTPGEISVALPHDASQEELSALRAALHAWQSSGIGLHFIEVSAQEARATLEIRFVDESESAPRATSSATTSADCRLPEGLVPDEPGDTVAAELVRAQVKLRRNNVDLLGRPVPLSQEELAGTLLHELGHALGYPTHAAAGASVMVQSTDRVRKQGRRVLENDGADFSAPTVGALYSVPSGAVIESLEIHSERMAEVRRLSAIAKRSGWGPPYARVGDRWARLWWIDAEGQIAGFFIPGVQRGWRPDLIWIPTRAAREHLAAHAVDGNAAQSAEP